MEVKQKVLDVRGLSCPEPVVKTRQALAQGLDGELVVITDNTVSVENIRRFVTTTGYAFDLNSQDGDFLLTIRSR